MDRTTLSFERRVAIYTAVFLAGLSVMVVELLGSRISSPLSLRWNGPIAEEAPILTDDYAPVEYFALDIPRE